MATSEVTFRWATVTSASPLAIKMDGDSAALGLIPDSLIDPLTLSPGDRVRVEMSLRKVTIHGKAGGPIIAWSSVTGKPSTFAPASHSLSSHSGVIANSQLPERLQELAKDGSSGNANTFLHDGWYRGSGISNAPSADWYYIEVVAHASSWVYQRAIRLHTDDVYERWMRSGAWTSWKKVITNVETASGTVTISLSGSGPYTGSANVTFPAGRFSGQPSPRLQHILVHRSLVTILLSFLMARLV